MKNQEGQTSLDLATAEDVKCLLQDAMVASQASTTANGGSGSSMANSSLMATTCSPTTETVTLPTGASMTLSVPVPQVSVI